MLIRLTMLLAFATFLVGCRGANGQKQVPQNSRSHEDTLADTLITFNFKGHTYNLRSDRYKIRHFTEVWQDFGPFVEQWQNKELLFKKVDSVDVTGDGKLDICETRITVVDNLNALVQRRIFSEGERIWNDTLTIDHEPEQDVFSDSIFAFMKPDLNFYFAIKYLNEFISGPDNTASSRTDQRIIYQNLLQVYNNPAYWRSYLQNFKGRYVFNLSQAEYETYIWDARAKQFIECYVP